MAVSVERKIITEFIEMYKNMPCLWDPLSEAYKDLAQKSVGWEALAKKLREWDPNANAASAKKKADNLKAAYYREVKKVTESRKRALEYRKRAGSDEKDVHKPILWYFKLMSFLVERDEELKKSFTSDSVRSDVEEEPLREPSKRRLESRNHYLENKRQKLINVAPEMRQTERKVTNHFINYVGERLDGMSFSQRAIAEKLISDVIFLANTNNLNVDSRIETPSNSGFSTYASQFNTSLRVKNSPTSSHISISPPYSSDYNTIIPSPSYEHDQTPRITLAMQPTTSPQPETIIFNIPGSPEIPSQTYTRPNSSPPTVDLEVDDTKEGSAMLKQLLVLGNK